MEQTVPVTFDLEKVRAEVSPLVMGTASLDLAAKKILSSPVEDWSEETANEAVSVRNEAASRAQKIADKYDPLRDMAHKLHKSIMSICNTDAGPLLVIKGKLTEAVERFAKLQLEAKRKAEEKLEKVAQRERGALLSEANDLLAKGYVEEAENLQREAEMVVAPTLPQALPKLKGASVIPKWKGEVTDLPAFIKAVATGRVPLVHPYKGGGNYTGPAERPILLVDQSVLDQVVSRLGDGVKWPGVTVTEDVSIRPRKL